MSSLPAGAATWTWSSPIGDTSVTHRSSHRPRVDRLRWRYVLAMGDEQHKTEELKVIQTEREAEERERAQSALDEEEAAQHQRRADKARYLREKLEEREESERRLDE